ncbi:MAG: hypothetical protein AAF950_13610 [Pseudomonadota bacterium]
MKTLCMLCAVVGLAACGAETPADNVPELGGPGAPPPAALTLVEQIDQVETAGVTFEFATDLDRLAADYVKLALHFGAIDDNYVDAYHGPAVWWDAVPSRFDELTDGDPDIDVKDLPRWPVWRDEELAKIREEAGQLQNAIAELNLANQVDSFRATQLQKILRALIVRLDVVAGNPVSFDTEVANIYDVELPIYDLSQYDTVLAEIDALLPGKGSTAERVDAFRNTLAIPEDKLQTVFDRAIAECRTRTAEHFDLPEGESFRMEFVNDKPWSGYNYYQGNYESLIQINTDFPIIIDRAVDLGCHEGYPGHHVWNLFIERDLVGNRGWIEYTVNPLFGPFGPIAEGSANYGIDLAFPGDEKITFERDVLFPMAGLDPDLAGKLEDLNALTGRLSHATNEIARLYLDGELTAEEALPLMQKYYLASEEKSAQRLRFVDTYRGYVINYNIGQDIVRAYVETSDDPWAQFERVLTAPFTASDILSELDTPE